MIMIKKIDFRSDTSTSPTPAMLKAMSVAACGNEGYGDDPTLCRLEKRAADLFAKEAALFVPSGTMGNLVAVMSHVGRGDEVILEANSHIITNECGGLCVAAGAIPRTIVGERGVMALAQMKELIRKKSSKTPKTGLLCLENTHNKSGGSVLPLSYIKSVGNLAHSYGIPVHMDGARIFNASVATSVHVKEIAAPVDSVMFCLSKGLSCPAGSLLVGGADFIERAKYNKKLLGGVLRQTGILAAAGLVALDEMIERLRDDHDKARNLAQSLAHMKNIEIKVGTVETNMVYFRLCLEEDICLKIIDSMKANGILLDYKGDGIVRMVTHKDITEDDIDLTLNLLSTQVGMY